MIQISANKNIDSAVIHLSGSKSISNRLLLLKHVLKAKTRLINLSNSNDTINLGEAISQISHHQSQTIDVGHAGTNMRFLTACLSATPGEWTITGSARMCERPIKDLVDALKQLGSDIHYLSKEGYPPLKINGQILHQHLCEVNASTSSQYITALLLMSPLLPNGLQLHLKGTQVSKPYTQMTVNILKGFGMTIEEKNDSILVAPIQNHQGFMPDNFTIESDWSSAAYWYSICALSKNAKVKLSHLHKQSLQADAVIQNIMQKLGVQSDFNDGTVNLSRTEKKTDSLSYDCLACPDLAQTLASLSVGLGVEAHLTGLQTLKIKETDRLLALKTELEKFGATVRVDDDTLHVIPQPPDNWRNQSITINTYNDHRMALSFAPLAMVCKGIVFDDERVIDKSYPAFWDDLKSAGFNVNLLP